MLHNFGEQELSVTVNKTNIGTDFSSSCFEYGRATSSWNSHLEAE